MSLVDRVTILGMYPTIAILRFFNKRNGGTVDGDLSFPYSGLSQFYLSLGKISEAYRACSEGRKWLGLEPMARDEYESLAVG